MLADGYCTTITIDHFVAQIFAFTANVDVELEPSTLAYLRQIWPIQPPVVDWTPTPALDAEGVKALANVFTR